MRSTTGFHAGVIGFFNTSTTPISLVASSTDAFNTPEIAMISSSGLAPVLCDRKERPERQRAGRSRSHDPQFPEDGPDTHRRANRPSDEHGYHAARQEVSN